jgi:hypothetical protein
MLGSASELNWNRGNIPLAEQLYLDYTVESQE